MSFIDLASLAMHRRNELEVRINMFLEKCDIAINNVGKLKTEAQGLIQNLNCDPSELKERFLNCMKQLDEYTYLITDFNLAISSIDSKPSEHTPIQDFSIPLKPIPTAVTYNLIDTLSDPVPSTSKVERVLCDKKCVEKRVRRKVPKDEQLLIAFSSSSCSLESVPAMKNEKAVQDLAENSDLLEIEKVERLNLDNSGLAEEINLPAQTVLALEKMYPANIMHIDGMSFWIVTEDPNELLDLLTEMTTYYKENPVELTLQELMALTYCAVYDLISDLYFRALFIRLTETDMSVAEIFLVDTGETKCSPTDLIQPLHPSFCTQAPYARYCHLSGIDLNAQLNKSVAEEQENIIKEFCKKSCWIRIEENSSESLEVFLFQSSGESLNDILIQKGLALELDRRGRELVKGPPELIDDKFDITDCPEYEDPVEAVAGYRNRDEIDICKHYKGGPEKTCFKGARCTKKHVKNNPDGWTQDRISVPTRCKSVALPAPGTWHRVLVNYVAHYDRFYVHFLPINSPVKKDTQKFGVILPPSTLEELVQDMNCPATRMSYKPLKVIPSPGELVAALYQDEQWYRAKVLSLTRFDQNVEVMYIDYGNIVWVKEDAIRELDPRHCILEAQAVRCVLAGVVAKSSESSQWAAAKKALSNLIHDKTLQAHIIAQEYDEVIVELFDSNGYSIAEQLAAGQFVNLKEYSVVKQKNDSPNLTVP